MSTARLTPVQQHLSDIIGKTARRSTSTIARGPMEHDIFGRRLNLQGQFVETSDSSARLNTAALDLSAALKSNTGGIETALKGEVMYYDVRSKTLRQQPALAALMALAYAKELQVRSGKPDGHVINVAVDCYAKHYDMMSVFADTIARSEAVQNGGGVIFWGVQNGGSIRNVAEFQSAANLAGGNWIYGTVSHLAKPEIAGTKLGMLGKVFCGTDLMKDLYARLTTGDFAALRAVENAADNFITVGDMTAHNLAVAEDMIRARTGATCPTDELLAGLRIGTDICHSPLGLNFYLMASHFGADVRTLNENLSPDFSVADITDPNEHETPKMAEFRTRTYDRRTWGILDPDADRGTFIALNANGVPVSLTGTHLLKLTAYNWATHNPQGLDKGPDWRSSCSWKH
ncbi:MAG: hypothetical protein NTZ10_04355 [Candidatus Saganbacteria bacterium]|nr:hypothetical protein [Candidatus Saganbacteria bacterium]